MPHAHGDGHEEGNHDHRKGPKKEKKNLLTDSESKLSSEDEENPEESEHSHEHEDVIKKQVSIKIKVHGDHHHHAKEVEDTHSIRSDLIKLAFDIPYMSKQSLESFEFSKEGYFNLTKISSEHSSFYKVETRCGKTIPMTPGGSLPGTPHS